jgi:hypothetical protein
MVYVFRDMQIRAKIDPIMLPGAAELCRGSVDSSALLQEDTIRYMMLVQGSVRFLDATWVSMSCVYSQWCVYAHLCIEHGEGHTEGAEIF